MAALPLVYVLNGPNLNLLGMREPEIYGSDTLDDIATRLEDKAKALGLEIDMRQSNHEGHLIDWLHEAQARDAKAVLLNAGAAFLVAGEGVGEDEVHGGARPPPIRRFSRSGPRSP